MNLIDCQNLTLGYDKHPVIENINLSISEGEYLCIVGENGSGKTTLMKALLGLLKPMSGIIVYDNIQPTQIGYMPQTTYISKNFPAGVEEVVLSGCLNKLGHRLFYSADEKRNAREQMEILDILPYKHKSFRELSGGQRQRVLLARALCATEKLLLLDEPVAGLDPSVTVELYELIKHLNTHHGIGIVMISHDLSAALKYSDSILHIAKGHMYYGNSSEYTKSEQYAFLTGGM